MPRGGPRANSGGAREGAGRPSLPTVPYQAKLRPETIERMKQAKARHGCGNIGELIEMALDALEREEKMEIKTIFGNTFDWEAVVAHMDDEIREAIHATSPDVSPQDFYAIYVIAHFDKYGEEFEFDKENPQV